MLIEAPGIDSPGKDTERYSTPVPKRAVGPLRRGLENAIELIDKLLAVEASDKPILSRNCQTEELPQPGVTFKFLTPKRIGYSIWLLLLEIHPRTKYRPSGRHI
jgi:hypothetical protein